MLLCFADGKNENNTLGVPAEDRPLPQWAWEEEEAVEVMGRSTG